MIPQSFIDDLLARLDIVDVVGKRLQLKRAGANLSACCPFHDERSPSFTVSPTKQFYHCLAGETRVITRHGTRPIRELAGSSHGVLDANGHWVEAPFRSYGVQRLHRLTLSRNGLGKTVRATEGHRWFTRGRKSALTTCELKPGHRLEAVLPAPADDWTLDPEGIRHGIVFGDGVVQRGYGHVHLHGAKDTALAACFPDQTAVERIRDGDKPYLRVYGGKAFAEFKKLPIAGSSRAYLLGFLAGYFAADGHVAKDGTVILNSARREDLEWVRQTATALGLACYGITTVWRKGLAQESRPLHRIHFVPSTLEEPFFLLKEAQDLFRRSTKAFKRLRWTVVSVEPLAEEEEVFCAEVPTTHSFVLEDNLLTGNCFGCGAHGTAIRFVMEYENLGFVEAVESLAASLGLEVPNQRGPGGAPGKSRSEALRPLLDAAAALYRQKLGETPRAVDYLKRRGLTGQIAKRFGLGYAPEGWDALADIFADYRSNADLVEAGLVVAGEAGKRHDRFRDRIMFPITDSAGRMIGFGGRILDRGEPKYLNSPETPLFSKGRELFGLWPAKDAMKRENRAIVVEGYMDVVALAQHGVENAVATLGTATTPTHVQKLLRMVDEIVFCFDGDAAGRRAAWRALENSLGVLRDDARLKFLFLPDGEDPDSHVRQVGAEGFRQALGGALSLAAFMVRELTAQAEGDAVEAAAQIVHRAEPLLRQIQAPALALLLRKHVADAAGLSSGEVEGLVGQADSRSERPRAPALRQRRVAGSLAALLLSRILRAPSLARHIDAARAAALDEEPARAALLEVMALCARQGDLSVEALAGLLRDSPHAAACRDAARLTRDLPEDVDLAEEVAALAARLPDGDGEADAVDLAALDPAERAAWLADVRRRKGVSDT